MNISKFTGGNFFVRRLHTCLILKLEEHPSVKISKFTGGNFFVCRLNKSAFDSQAKQTPECKKQQVYRWHCFCLSSAQVFVFQAKRTPKCKNQQVYQWQIMRLLSA